MRRLILAAALAIASCLPAAAKQGAAKASFQSDLDACIDQQDTKELMDACRQEVEARWGRGKVTWPLADAGIADAGGDQ